MKKKILLMVINMNIGGTEKALRTMLSEIDKEKYDGLSDLITIRRPYHFPLWELPADSLKRHPYIKDMETALSIILFRDNNPRESWTVDGLCSAGIISVSDADRLRKCVL
jgi:hypothetical protein